MSLYRTGGNGTLDVTVAVKNEAVAGDTYTADKSGVYVCIYIMPPSSNSGLSARFTTTGTVVTQFNGYAYNSSANPNSRYYMMIARLNAGDTVTTVTVGSSEHAIYTIIRVG